MLRQKLFGIVHYVQSMWVNWLSKAIVIRGKMNGHEKSFKITVR